MSREPNEILRDALVHLRTMQTYAEHDLDDQLVIDAVCMRLSAGIEALATLDADVRDQLFGTDWPLMWGMRNRIAHGYLLVDTTIPAGHWHRTSRGSSTASEADSHPNDGRTGHCDTAEVGRW